VEAGSERPDPAPRVEPLLLRVDVALPVLAAAVVIALAAVELRFGR
jgi:hypothetical protein